MRPQSTAPTGPPSPSPAHVGHQVETTLAEKLSQPRAPIRKDPIQIARNEAAGHQVAEWGEGQRIANTVAHERAAVPLLELVRVHPLAIRATDLPVDEAVIRHPVLDDALPPHRHAAERELVVDRR